MADGRPSHPRLFDAHCHLQDERVPRDSLPALLEEASAAGIQRLALNGCWQEDWGAVLDIARAHPDRFAPNIGLHPWWVHQRSADWLQQLRKLLEDNPTCGLGECGLDKGPRAKDLPPAEDQQEAFEAQLALAQELRRPVSIHCVRAYGPLHEALQRHAADVPVVLHSWCGSAEMVTTLLQLPNQRIYFSLSGYLTKLPPAKAVPMVRTIPLGRLLLESDAPDGALALPEAWLEALPSLKELRGRIGGRFAETTTPAVVAATLDVVAAALGRSKAEVAAATYANAAAVFDPTQWREGGSRGEEDGQAAAAEAVAAGL